MSYAIAIPEIVAEKIRKLPPVILDEVEDRIDALGENPRLARTIDRGPLAGRMLFEFRVDRSPLTWKVGILFQFRADEETIELTDVGILHGDPPRLES